MKQTSVAAWFCDSRSRKANEGLRNINLYCAAAALQF